MHTGVCTCAFMMDCICVAAVNCLMKCVISAHIHSLHVKPIIIISSYNIRHVCLQHLPHVHIYVYIIHTSHGLLYSLVKNLFLIWIVHTRTVVVTMHNLCTCTSNIHDRALFSVYTGVCGCMYMCMCTHNCVWYGNRGSIASFTPSLHRSLDPPSLRPPSNPLPPLSFSWMIFHRRCSVQEISPETSRPSETQINAHVNA